MMARRQIDQFSSGFYKQSCCVSLDACSGRFHPESLEHTDSSSSSIVLSSPLTVPPPILCTMAQHEGLLSYLLTQTQRQSLPALVLGSIALYCCSWAVYARYLHPFHDIPGPFLASISRLWMGASVLSGRAEHTQRALHQKYGPLVRIAPNEVSVADPEAIKVIYNIKSGFTKTDFYPPFAPNISPHGDHFSQLDEKKHAERRRYVNATYSMSTILESEQYIDACSDVFMEKMARFAESGQAVDFGEWIQW